MKIQDLLLWILVLLSIKCRSGESSSFLEKDKNDICNEDSNSCTEEDYNRRIFKKPSPTKLFENVLSQRIFNTTMNFIVPGAKVQLPHNNEEGSLIHLAMQAFFGIFWAVAWISTIAVPFALTYFQPLGLRSFDNPNDFHLNWELNDKLAEGIGLNWTSCLQKTICQAHQPIRVDKYGVLGKIIRFLFPASANISTLPISSTPYHESAQRGSIGQNCNHIYKCFFDVLDVIFYVKEASSCFAVFPP